MKKHYLLFFIFSFTLLGCEKISFDSNYQIAVTSDGKTYRLNTKTGKVHSIIKNKLREVPLMPEEKRKKISIGEIFETEKGKLYIYNGSGKFNEKKTLTDEEFMKGAW